MQRSSYLFTSESVSEGHPDKVADRISDTVLDAYLTAYPESRVGCETFVTTQRVVIGGEVRGPESVTKDYLEELDRAAIKDIGYEQEGFHWKTAEVDVSFSATIGPVYLRIDRLGLVFLLDTGKPPEEANLRVVDLHFESKFPQGIAVNVETSLVAGGGAIVHDPDQGTYFGILDLAFKGGLTIQAICLVATKQDGVNDANEGAVGTDPEGKSQNRDDSKARRF